METIVREKSINSIPILEVFQREGKTKKPMVFLYHGYMGRKEFILPQAYLLARNGFFTVVPDAHGHGDRDTGKIANLFESVVKSTEEINLLMDHYKDSEEADITRAGISGYSMGGFITYAYIVSGDRRVKAAVPIISTPDWVSVVESFSAGEKMGELKAAGIIEKESDAENFFNLARTFQPINQYEKMKDIPLLMLSGESDEVTPPEGVKRLYELLEPIFYDKEALKHIIYPGIGHGDTVQMNMEMVRWMKRYLQNT